MKIHHAAHAILIMMAIYFIGPDSLLSVAFTCDGLLSTLEFLINHRRNYQLTGVSKYQTSAVFLRVNTLDRYLVYSAMMLISLLSYCLFWSYGRYLSWCLYVFLMPWVNEQIINTHIYGIYRKFCISELRKCGVYIASHQLARLLNMVANVSLQCRPNIHYQEIEPLFENYVQFGMSAFDFIKKFLMSSLVHYVNHSGHSVYAMIIRYAYFNNFRSKEVKQVKVEIGEIRRIVLERDWDRFLHADTMTSILYVYQNGKGGNVVAQYINNLTSKLNYSVFKVFAIWSIVSIVQLSNVPTPILITSLSILLMNNHRNIAGWLIRLSILIFELLLPGGKELLWIVAAETGYYIYLAIKPFGNYLNKNFRYGKMSRLITITYHDILYLFYPWVVYYLSTSYVELMTFALVYSLTYDPFLRKALLMLGYLFGFVSDYNTFHLSILSFLAYVAYKLFHQPVRDVKLVRKKDDYLDEHERTSYPPKNNENEARDPSMNELSMNRLLTNKLDGENMSNCNQNPIDERRKVHNASSINVHSDYLSRDS